MSHDAIGLHQVCQADWLQCAVLVLSLAGLSACSPAAASDIQVSTSAEVQSALARAKPGDTISFTSGTYGPVRTSGKWAEPGITLRPAPNAKVLIIGARVPDGRMQGPFTFDSAAGITVEGFELNTMDAVGIWMAGVNQRIVLRNLDIHGEIVATDDIARKNTGLAVHFGNGAINSALEYSDIHHVQGGIAAVGGAGLHIIGNRVHDLVGDAMHFAPGPDTVIEGNIIGPLYAAPGPHLDGIQITTTGLGKPSTGLIIRRNRLTRGTAAGNPYQGIFMADEGKVGIIGPLIEENVISTGNYHGISLYNTTAPIVRGNYVAGDAGALDGTKVMVPWVRCVNCTDVVMKDNIATLGGQKTIAISRAGDFSAADAQWAKLPPLAGRPDAKPAPAVAALPTPSDPLAAMTERALAAERALAVAKAQLAAQKAAAGN